MWQSGWSWLHHVHPGLGGLLRKLLRQLGRTEAPPHCFGESERNRKGNPRSQHKTLKIQYVHCLGLDRRKVVRQQDKPAGDTAHVWTNQNSVYSDHVEAFILNPLHVSPRFFYLCKSLPRRACNDCWMGQQKPSQLPSIIICAMNLFNMEMRVQIRRTPSLKRLISVHRECFAKSPLTMYTYVTVLIRPLSAFVIVSGDRRCKVLQPQVPILRSVWFIASKNVAGEKGTAPSGVSASVPLFVPCPVNTHTSIYVHTYTSSAQCPQHLCCHSYFFIRLSFPAFSTHRVLSLKTKENREACRNTDAGQGNESRELKTGFL